MQVICNVCMYLSRLHLDGSEQIICTYLYIILSSSNSYL